MHKNERGFTLIELMVAIAIAGLITGGITAAIIQILTVNTRASNHMICVRQVQQAGKEVSKDALQARPGSINVTPPGGGLLTLNWTDWEGEVNQVAYNITSDGELQRWHNDDGVRVIAQYIDPDQTGCNWTGSVLTFTVTAAVGTESETRIYEIEPRPG
jgi:prepilin-type N-terminal cleavage/methylation domain-containing protein